MQNKTKTNNTNSTKSSDKNSFKINLAYLESDSMTNAIFGVNASLETNDHISSYETERVFDGNVIHYNEVKHSTFDDYEELKY